MFLCNTEPLLKRYKVKILSRPVKNLLWRYWWFASTSSLNKLKWVDSVPSGFFDAVLITLEIFYENLLGFLCPFSCQTFKYISRFIPCFWEFFSGYLEESFGISLDIIL